MNYGKITDEELQIRKHKILVAICHFRNTGKQISWVKIAVHMQIPYSTLTSTRKYLPHRDKDHIDKAFNDVVALNGNTREKIIPNGKVKQNEITKART